MIIASHIVSRRVSNRSVALAASCSTVILANRNYMPIDFIVLDIDCNPSCPIILGRPFLRTIGVVINMEEGNIKF